MTIFIIDSTFEYFDPEPEIRLCNNLNYCYYLRNDGTMGTTDLGWTLERYSNSPGYKVLDVL